MATYTNGKAPTLEEQLAAAKLSAAAADERWEQSLAGVARAIKVRKVASDERVAARDRLRDIEHQIEAHEALAANPDIFAAIDRAEADMAKADAALKAAQGNFNHLMRVRGGATTLGGASVASTARTAREFEGAEGALEAARVVLEARRSEWEKAATRLTGLQMQRDAALRARMLTKAKAEAEELAQTNEEQRASRFARAVERLRG